MTKWFLEQRTVELTLPADPANAESESRTLSQAGQVWFPDSAFKVKYRNYCYARYRYLYFLEIVPHRSCNENLSYV